MTSVLSNNKRIAKNTLLLYFRMMITMLIGLYTSRVVLNTLGIEDFGIYNVVGGVIAMFAFVNGAMANATSRYLTIELGRENWQRLKSTFSTALTIHAMIALLIIILGETIGLWFLLNKMIIPDARLEAAMWVYQLSIVSMAVSIMSVPFNASIISHEKMSAFAYITIFDVIMKLLIVFLLLFIPYDKLKVHAILLFLTQLLNQLIYMIYCKRNFYETSFRPKIDKSLFKEISVFAGWNLYGNLSYITYSQGVNILLNVFFGPAINAARGIAVQVQSMIYSFVSNFQTALNPQITKSYANGNVVYMNQLIVMGSKFSFYLLLLIAIPLMIEAPYILRLWLVQVPEHAVSFFRILVLINLTDALSTPVAISIQATGQIKTPQLITGSILMAILPVSYVALKMGAPAEAVFVIHLVSAIAAQISRIILLSHRITFSIRNYLKDVISPILFVLVVVCAISIAIYHYCYTENIWSMIMVCIATICINIIIFYSLGLNSNERRFIREKFVSFKKKIGLNS